MLVLSRQRDESIVIGDNIVITIVDIRGDKVRLGINAPTEIPVHRQEVYDAIQRENLRSARLDPKDAQSFTTRGNAHQQKGDLDQALTDLNEAILLDPKFPGAFQNRGDVQEAKGDFEAAIAGTSEGFRCCGEACTG